MIMTLATLACWAAWGYIFCAVNPEITNGIGFFLFYASLFLALTGTAALVGFTVRFIGLKQGLAFHSAKEAFRQSFLFSFLIIICLILLAKGLFTWLNLGLLIMGLSVLEFFLISYKKA